MNLEELAIKIRSKQESMTDSNANACAHSLTREQREILYHTEHRAAGGFYCGGGKEMDALVAAGLMQSAGRKSFVPDEYFRITPAGRAALRSQNEE